jgi:hypothetical protein
MALKRFTNPKFLEQIGRELLKRLLDGYRPAFGANGLRLPDETLPDAEYYGALAKLAMAEQGLPAPLVEALYGIEAMANEHGKARLVQGVEEAGLRLENIQQATLADFAVQVLLADPDLFNEKLDQMRITSLTSFEYHGCEEPVDRRATFVAPGADLVARIKGDIDRWLAEQREGDEEATEVEPHQVDGEFWFLIRRGDAFARIPVVEGVRFAVRHLRPARDLVVAYSPERDELRVHARTAGEKRMLRRVFGQRLFGNPDYFSVRKAFTLRPLRDDGPDALEVGPGGGIDRIVLTELEVRTNDEHDAVVDWKANDLFAFAEATGQRIIPPGGQLVRASFEVQFTGREKARTVVLRAGNRLRVARHSDVAAVHRWLASKGFRSAEEEPVNRVSALTDERLERN